MTTTLNVSVEKSVVVVVEGIDDRYLLDYLCGQWGITNVQAISLNTKPNYDNVLAVVNLANFNDKVQAFGIMRDADNDFLSAKASVEGILTRLNLNQKTGFFILPDNQGTGMMETLLIQASLGDVDRTECVNSFMQCLNSKQIHFPANVKDKARIYAYLSSYDEPGRRISEAARASCWDANNQAFESLKNFLNQLQPVI